MSLLEAAAREQTDCCSDKVFLVVVVAEDVAPSEEPTLKQHGGLRHDCSGTIGDPTRANICNAAILYASLEINPMIQRQEPNYSISEVRCSAIDRLIRFNVSNSSDGCIRTVPAD